MPRPRSSFNDGDPRNYTAIEPKDAYVCKDSWWIQPTRNDFIVRRDAELPRILKSKALGATAESGNTARQVFVNKSRKHPALGWLPTPRIPGAE